MREEAATSHAQLRKEGRWAVPDGEDSREGGSLPQGLITAICVKYKRVPGPQTSALRARSPTYSIEAYSSDYSQYFLSKKIFLGGTFSPYYQLRPPPTTPTPPPPPPRTSTHVHPASGA